MRILYPMLVAGTGLGRWFVLPNDLTIKPMSGRFVTKNGSNIELATPSATNILGWLDMPNDARVYQMDDIFESTLNPDYQYKAGDYVFIVTNDLDASLFRIPLVGGNLADVSPGSAYALVVDADGNQGIDTTYSGTEKQVIVEEVNSETDIIVRLIS